MADVKFNPSGGMFHGKIGDLVFVRRPDGTVFVRHAPVRKAEFTEGELAAQDRLKASNRYVKNAKNDPEIFAAYQEAAKLQGKRACDLAKSDFAHAPAIHDVDLTGYHGRIGDTIRIAAVDDFGVTSVYVALAKLDEMLIENGAAILEGKLWVYHAQVAVTEEQMIAVHMAACDRAANVVVKTVHHALVPAGGA